MKHSTNVSVLDFGKGSMKPVRTSNENPELRLLFETRQVEHVDVMKSVSVEVEFNSYSRSRLRAGRGPIVDGGKVSSLLYVVSL